LDEVVIDESARGKGVGAALVQASLDLARAKGVQVVELQSGVQREEANRLYPSMGLKRRETNVYRIVLHPPAQTRIPGGGLKWSTQHLTGAGKVCLLQGGVVETKVS